MKKIKNILAAIILLIALVIGTNFFFGASSGEGGYLENSIGNTLDTINTASANDTSRTFENRQGYKVVWCEFLQNGRLAMFKVDYERPGTLRLRYVAADSSLTCETQALIGWMPVPLLTTVTDANRQAAYSLSLKTGVAVISFRGREEE